MIFDGKSGGNQHSFDVGLKRMVVAAMTAASPDMDKEDYGLAVLGRCAPVVAARVAQYDIWRARALWDAIEQTRPAKFGIQVRISGQCLIGGSVDRKIIVSVDP